jgi:N6-L-threonylcarbamoyladenine synthase
MATVLALETSCDETAAAVVRDRVVLSNVVASQIDIHRRFGGVVPEVASRAHVENMGAVTATALDAGGAGLGGDRRHRGHLCAGARGGADGGANGGQNPGHGITTSPFSVSIIWRDISTPAYLSQPELQPPFLCLLVSGGHTSLIHVRGCGDYAVLGQTRDDAAGEAFDKVARLLGLGYPGGPIIDKLAAQGDATAFPLPEGNISLPEGGFHRYDSSFQRLENGGAAVGAVPQRLRNVDPLPVADLAASFQATVARSLTKRTLNCALDYGLTTIAVGGGVAANSGLRQRLTTAAAEHGLTVLFPPLKYCTDNAAMIACAAADHLSRDHVSTLELAAQSRLPLTAVMDLYGRRPL